MRMYQALQNALSIDVQVKCGDAGADARIAQKVQNCCAWADKNPGKRTQVPPSARHLFVI